MSERHIAANGFFSLEKAKPQRDEHTVLQDVSYSTTGTEQKYSTQDLKVCTGCGKNRAGITLCHAKLQVKGLFVRE